MSGLKLRSITTSTRRRSSCSKSETRPPGNQGVVFGPTEISKSKSLCGPASPRANEPNTRTLYAPLLRGDPLDFLPIVLQ